MPEAQQPADSGQDTPETGKSGKGKLPRHKRVENQFVRALEIQGQQVQQLVGAVNKLVERESASNGQPQQNPAATTLDGLSPDDLRSVIQSPETDERMKYEATLALVNRSVQDQVSKVKDDLVRTAESERQVNQRSQQVRDALRRSYGDDILDSSTDLGGMKERIFNTFAERYGQQAHSMPELEVLAAKLAAEQLGVAYAPEPGSAEESEESESPAPPSKSGPPEGALPEGGSEGFAERISRGKEALKANSPEGNKGFLREAMGLLYPEHSGR